ncbi:hypothetical protein QBC47DRAFT_358020 [Echria macrotheca]|uniref:Uncharacterized protein n=1 Tax=Echria macrotheca TaxID=438768 RepID=A0AAJ0BJ70_9PEZI|nr:hypothetical protein QBC47DRAFT_358020 [Echria macrotheca]
MSGSPRDGRSKAQKAMDQMPPTPTEWVAYDHKFGLAKRPTPEIQKGAMWNYGGPVIWATMVYIKSQEKKGYPDRLTVARGYMRIRNANVVTYPDGTTNWQPVNLLQGVKNHEHKPPTYIPVTPGVADPVEGTVYFDFSHVIIPECKGPGVFVDLWIEFQKNQTKKTDPIAQNLAVWVVNTKINLDCVDLAQRQLIDSLRTRRRAFHIYDRTQQLLHDWGCAKNPTKKQTGKAEDQAKSERAQFENLIAQYAQNLAQAGMWQEEESAAEGSQMSWGQPADNNSYYGY